MAAPFPSSSALSSQELDRLYGAIVRTYNFPTSAGGAVTFSATRTFNISAVTANYVVVNGTLDTTGQSSGSVTLDVGDSNPRRDHIYYQPGTGFGVVKGTAVASTSTTGPVLPSLSANQISLAEVAVAANATTLSGGNITDRRLSTSVIDSQTFTGNGTWTKPTGITANSRTLIRVWGGGGSGGGAEGRAAANDRVGGGGGGGGGFREVTLATSSLGATETVTIAAATTGGSGGSTADGSNGTAGNNTTFGSWVTGYGGGRGSGGTGTTSTGGGGGMMSGSCGIGSGNAKASITNKGTAKEQGGCETDVEKHLLKRQARMGLLEKDKIALRMTTPWRPDVHVGDLVGLNWQCKPRGQNSAGGMVYGSGTYLVTALSHKIMLGGFATTTMDCVAQTAGGGIL